MTEVAVKKTRAKRVVKESATPIDQELLLSIKAKMDDMESQLKERDDKLKALEKPKSRTGFEKYGSSDWESYEAGKEKVIFRSNYVDIQGMVDNSFNRKTY